jgi:hypothetical protein
MAELLSMKIRRVAVRTWAALAAVLCTPADAVDYQIHGYAAQGFVYSSDNNFFGESSDGSFDYYEAGINAAVQVRPNLLVAAQAAIRDAGISDDGTLRLDYALVDYRALSDGALQAGVRAGKIKNSLGFYNETRDVVFTRPSILLPSVYSDNQNQRSLIFTSPGAQLYASTVTGKHELSFTGTANAERDVRKSDERLLVNLTVPFDLRIGDSWNVQLMDSLDGGKWQFAYSYFAGQFRLSTAPEINLVGRFDIDLNVFSVRHNAERFTITAEYVVVGNDNSLTFQGTPIVQTRIDADSAYLQGEYRINRQWGAMARIDGFFLDRTDRSGRDFAAANPGAARRSRFSRDLVVGLNWRPDEHWGVWGEYHWINGTASLQALENPPPVREQRWSMLMLMAGYKF